MFRRLAFLLSIILSLFFRSSIYAQADTSHLRVSLITCGPGNEFIGASFGHNGIRITDNLTGKDEAYNYGTFDFNEQNFELRFAQGTLVYSLAKDNYQNFLQEYIHSGRAVLEQVLNLTGAEKIKLRDLLEENLLPQNRGYIYSSVYDNCATRVRDVLRKATNDQLKYGPAIPPELKLTYRDIWNAHLTGQVWERFGINVLTGTNVDHPITSEQAMFLPEYLAEACAGATVGSKKLVLETNQVLPQRAVIPQDKTIDPPFWTLLTISFIIIICQVIPSLQKVGKFLGRVLLLLTGLLGCFMVVMWAGTDHKICENNLNLLWALPTNIIAAFKRRNISKYALVAIVLIFVGLGLHVARIHVLPLANLWPVLLALLVTYGMIYRRNN